MSARARESNLWNWLRDGAPDDCFMERIENSIAVGTPDVFGVWRGVAFCAELKSVGRRPTGDVWCEVKTDQAMFLRAWRRAGGLSWVLVQVGVMHAARRYLVDGVLSDQLLEPLPELALRSLSMQSHMVDHGMQSARWLIERMTGA